MKWKMSGRGCRILCVVHAKDADEAFRKARSILGDIITGCQMWDPRFDSNQDRVWLEIE